MSRRERNDVPQPGGETPVPAAFAGVNLLPQEYYTALRERRLLRLLALGVVGVLLIGVVGSLGAGLLAQNAQAGLAAEQRRGVQLRDERARYGEVTEVLAELDTARAAQAIALYAEADWSRISREFDSALPEGSATLGLNLGQRLSPAVSGGTGLTDSSEATPLSGLSPVFVEYRIVSGAVDAGEQLLDRLAVLMTGYEWAAQTSAKRDSDGVYTFSGLMRLGMPAIGTARAESIDEATLEALRESLAQAATDEAATVRGVQ